MAELRQRPNPRKYKTVLCRNVVQGRDCPYGSRCDYIHASDISAAATTSPARLPRVPMQQILCPGGNSGALTIDPGRDHMYRSIGTPAPAASPIYSVSRPAEGRGRTHLGAYISLLEQMHPRALGNACKEMNLAAEYERYNGIFAAFGAARSARPAAWSSAEMLYTSFGFPETRPDALLDQLRSQK
ncbi:hypothetical protein GGF46_003516 [Coemansia sp. RSA 552]|nr:hypothetical protein GGF46_003516 [Coemansia sp. RSA 552]